MIKNVQQIKTIFPIGRSDDKRVSTTSLRPGALLITRRGRSVLSRRNTLRMPKIFGLFIAIKLTNTSINDIMTKKPSILFQPLFKYAFSPRQKPFAIILINISKANIRVNA